MKHERESEKLDEPLHEAISPRRSEPKAALVNAWIKPQRLA
jgi:hypothetical protein